MGLKHCLSISYRLNTDPLSENGRVSLFEHFLEFIVGGGAARDLELSLYPALAAISVVGLRAVVLGHHLDELAGES